MPLIGTPEHRGSTLTILGVDAVGDDNPTIEIDDVSRFNEFTVMSADGSLKGFVSFDGVNFSSQIAWETMQETAGQTRSLVLAPGIGGPFVGYIRGQCKAIRIVQEGLTDVLNAVLICGESGRD